MTRAKKTQSDQGGKTAKKRALASKAGAKARASAPAEKEVTMDRRSGQERRTGDDRRKKSEPVEVERRKIERRAKVPRRRQIDPTTCERDYTADEIEFMNALDEYKRTSGRMFPTCSEILEVVRGLGYRKLPAADAAGEPSPGAGGAGVPEAPPPGPASDQSASAEGTPEPAI